MNLKWIIPKVKQIWKEQISNIQVSLNESRRENQVATIEAPKKKPKIKKRRFSIKSKKKANFIKSKNNFTSAQTVQKTLKESGDLKVQNRLEIHKKKQKKKSLVVINEISEHPSQINEKLSSDNNLSGDESNFMGAKIDIMKTMPASIGNTGNMQDHMFNKESMKSIMNVLTSKDDTEKKEMKKSIFFSQVENKLPIKRQQSQKNTQQDSHAKPVNKNAKIVQKLRKIKKNRFSYQALRTKKHYARSIDHQLTPQSHYMVPANQQFEGRSKANTLNQKNRKVNFDLSHAVFNHAPNVVHPKTHRERLNVFPGDDFCDIDNMPSPVPKFMNNNINFPIQKKKIVDDFSEEEDVEVDVEGPSPPRIRIQGMDWSPEFDYSPGPHNTNNIYSTEGRNLQSPQGAYGSNIHRYDVNKYMNYFQINDNKINFSK